MTRHPLLLLGVLLLGSRAGASGVDLGGTVTVPPGQSPEGSVVYLLGPSGRPAAPLPEPVVLDQRQLRFSPHVLVVQRGQRVRFPNTDLIRHNVFSPSKAHRFNLGIYPPGVTKEERFDKAGVVALLCNVHPEMSAFILVVDTPHFATTGPDGRFLLREVPPGRYEAVIWHEGLPELRQRVHVDASARPLRVALQRED